MHTIISALHFPWSTMDDCLRTVRDDLGLDGVELSLHGSFQRPHCTREDLEWLAATRPAVPLAAHIWEDLAQLGEEAGAAALEGWLPLCRATGISGMVIHGGSYPDRREGLRRTREIFAAVLPAFEAAGVRLLLENHYAYDYRDCQELFSEPWEFLELLQALPSPALRVCYDTGHGHMTRNGDALLRALAPYLDHVHLADNHGQDDDHCPYGMGTVPWTEVFDTLQAIGFNGAFCVEFPVRDDREPFRRCLEEIRGRWGGENTP